jgi:cell division protein FtsZ
MGFSIQFAEDTQQYQASIKVIGVGGSGGNAIDTMIHFGLEGVEFVSVNTDAQALNAGAAPIKVSIGANITRGLGAGANPDLGRKAAAEDVNRLKELVQGADMIFVTAGMGGGTGTGAAPVIAALAREAGALTVGVVTKPFSFEGRTRSRRADEGLDALNEHVDTLITIPNDKLLTLNDEDLTFVEAFRKADEVLYQAVRGISDLITLDGMVNVDFADVRSVMAGMGRALMGTGLAKGEGRARLAAEQAISSPLLDDISVEGAMGALINIVGGPDVKMREIKEAASLITEQAHPDANIIFGASIDESMSEAIKVTVIATGFDLSAGDIPIDVVAEAVRRVERPARESLVAPAPRSGASVTRATSVPPTQRDVAQAYSLRRGAAAAASLQAPAGAGSQPLPQVRERISFPSSPDADDWDTPAFQRRHSGNS